MNTNEILQMGRSIQIVFLTLVTACIVSASENVPVGVVFHEETLTRKGVRGDNWCQTWAVDDNIYTMMDDGNGYFHCGNSSRVITNSWLYVCLIHSAGCFPPGPHHERQ